MSTVLSEGELAGVEVTECFEVVIELTRPEYLHLRQVIAEDVKRGAFVGWEALGSQLVLVTTAGV